MSDERKERLSALMDGEADDQALEQVLDNVQDPTLREDSRRVRQVRRQAATLRLFRQSLGNSGTPGPVELKANRCAT